jgi:lipoate-protein ligase A
MQSWRLIPLLQLSGDRQMAIDRWLLEQHQHHQHPSTLRFYTWNPVAISLGYHQHQWPVHWQHLTWEGQPIDRVRRPTGGRAVLHQGDLTYAVITSGLPERRLDAYRYLCEFLRVGWRSLGVVLDYGTAGRGYIHHPSCFGTATIADLVMPDGYKLIGSAQLRRGRTVLQHGSIRLFPNPGLTQHVFGEPASLPQWPIYLDPSQLTGLVIEALTAAAQTWFDTQFEVLPLSNAEWQAIHQFSP